METKEVKVNGRKLTMLRYLDKWVFPMVRIYEHGLGSPICLTFFTVKKGELEEYSDVTVNLPGAQRGAGCQFIDNNNNNSNNDGGESILLWLVEAGFGEFTGKKFRSGFHEYPEFNFHKGENFWKFRQMSIDNGFLELEF